VNDLYEFGPFRVDPQKELLLRSGESIPLTPKTFQILLVLIRHNTQLVTKDDLMKTVWPDTFVEESNLSRNVFMLRKALGETAQDRQYIITVPGQGYRLAENVRLIPAQDLKIIAATQSKVQIQVSEERRWVKISVVAVVVIASVLGGIQFYRHRSPTLAVTDTVVLADFSNSTQDPVFDQTLRQGIAIELGQSPYLNLLPDQQIRRVLRLMGKAKDVSLTPELARDVCERTGSAAVLDGSIAKFGSAYVIGLRTVSCRTGAELDNELVQVQRKEDVLGALSQVATKLRRNVGESLAVLQEHDKPLSEVTTSSLEALEVYSAGLRVHYANGARSALPFFQKAVDIDPQFAMAYAYLGRTYANLDEPDLAAEAISRAWQLRNRVSDREKFAISTRYQALVTGDLEETRQVSDAWVRVYPRDPQPHIGLSLYYRATGQYEKAADQGRAAIEADPDFSIAYYDLAASLVDLKRPDEAENTLRRAAGRGLEIDEYAMLDYDVAFLRGDQAAMTRALQLARERSGTESWISNRQALSLAYRGHLREGRSLTKLARDQSMQVHQQQTAALYVAAAAVREALAGNRAQAKSFASETLALSKSRDAEYGAALALDLAGENGRAEELADDLERRFPKDTSVKFSDLPVLRALLALHRGDNSQALTELQEAVPDELGSQGSATHALFGALYPIYVRGEVYLAQKKGAEAVAEFRKVLDHREIVGSDLIGAIAKLELGRAYALMHDSEKAKSSYREFLAQWKDGDSDCPILRQAEAELARLS
jgi:DNA-binding winged helix-turn-helix (wHTH) protein/predicted Zn-dependent protease